MKSVEKILQCFEGTSITNMSQLSIALGRNRVTASRWNAERVPGKKKGCGGEVPRIGDNIASIKILAALHDIELPLEVWFND